jgi:TP901 family phage tail tape measure protein
MAGGGGSGFMIPIGGDPSGFITAANQVEAAVKEIFGVLRAEAAKGVPQPQLQGEFQAAGQMAAGELGRLYKQPGADILQIGAMRGRLQGAMDGLARQLGLEAVNLKEAGAKERYAREKESMERAKVSDALITERRNKLEGYAARNAYFRESPEGRRIEQDAALDRQRQAQYERYVNNQAKAAALSELISGRASYLEDGPDPSKIAGRSAYLEEKYARSVSLSQEGEYTDQDAAGAGALAYFRKKRLTQEELYANIALNADREYIESSGQLAALRKRRTTAEATAALRFTTAQDLLSQATLAASQARQRTLVATLQAEQVTEADIAASAQLAALKQRHSAQKNALVAAELAADSAYIQATVAATVAKNRTKLATDAGVLSATTEADLRQAARNDRDRALNEARQATYRNREQSPLDTASIGLGAAADVARTESERAAKLRTLASEESAVGRQYIQAKIEATVAQEQINQAIKLGAINAKTEQDYQRTAVLAEAEKRNQLRQQIANNRAILGLQQQEVKAEASIANLDAQNAALQRQINREKAKELAEINKAADPNGGGTTLFQRAQAFLKNKGSSRDNPVDASEQPRLGQFLGQKALTTAGFAVTGFAFYRGTQAIAEMVRNSVELERQFALLEIQFADTDEAGSFPQTRKAIFDIARSTGEAAEDVLEIFAQMKGAFSDAPEAATDAIVTIGKVTGITAKEAVDSITSIGKAFGLQGDELLKIGDLALGAQARYGVLAKETIAFLGDIAPVAQQAGASLEELATVAGVVQARSGRGGAAIAEALSRVLPRLSEKTAELLEIPGLNLDLENVAAGDTFKTYLELLEQYADLPQPSKNALIKIVGGDREAHAVISSLEDGQRIIRDIEKTAGDAGRSERALGQINETLSQQIAKLREEFKALGYALYEAGLGDILKALVQVLGTLIDAFELVGGALDTANDATGGLLGNFVKLYGIMKLIGALGVTKLLFGAPATTGLLGGLGGSAAAAGAGGFLSRRLFGGAATGGLLARLGLVGGLPAAGSLTGAGASLGLGGLFGGIAQGGLGAGLLGRGLAFLSSPLALAGGGYLLADKLLQGSGGFFGEGNKFNAPGPGVDTAATRTAIRAEIRKIEEKRSGFGRQVVGQLPFGGFGANAAAGKELQKAYTELYATFSEKQLEAAMRELERRGDNGTSFSERLKFGNDYKSKNEIQFNALKKELETRTNKRLGEDWISRIESARAAGLLTQDRADELIDALNAGEEGAIDDARDEIDDIINDDEKYDKYGAQRRKDQPARAKTKALRALEDQATAQLKDLEAIKDEYEAGDASLGQYLAALDDQIAVYEQLAAGGDEKFVATFKDLVKQRTELASAAAVKSAEVAIALGTAAGLISESNGDRVRIITAMLNDPTLTPAAREQQANNLISAVQGQLQAQLQRPGITASERRQLLEQGIKIPPELKRELERIQRDSPNEALGEFLKADRIKGTPEQRRTLTRRRKPTPLTMRVAISPRHTWPGIRLLSPVRHSKTPGGISVRPGNSTTRLLRSTLLLTRF